MKKISIFLVGCCAMALTFSCSPTSVEEVENIHYQNKVSALEQEILNLVNEHRVSIGLNELVFDQTAYDYALAHTRDMIAKNKLSHDGFDLRSSNLTVEAKANYVSEIVGRNFVTAKGVVNAWLKSESHRKAIEGDYNFSAVSAKSNSDGVFYYTQLFYK